MRVCIVGLGAVGGLVGARLAGSGVAVSALARGETLAAVRRDGLRLVGEGSYPILASDDVADLGTPDVVVLSVKTTALPAVAEQVGALAGPDTTVLSMTNGVPWWFFDGLDTRPEVPSLRAAAMAPIPRGSILGSVTHLSASRPAPGVVECRFLERLVVGEPRGDVSDRAVNLARVLSDAGLPTEVSPRIQADIWFKLWGNMTMNPLSAITGATMDLILDDPLTRAFASRCMSEAAAVGAAIGLPLDTTPEERHVVTRRLGAARTSMLQDVEAGRAVELDALVTSVVETGRAVGVATPELETLLGLARLHARVRGLF
ncbi:2-dehydropantoate 2-reductase [Nocardioides sp.]|uniref:2-dehydropantoate 2-reductase n=1 Tax=Nocardioides sp. TaxID=35761 RepID=UPI0039E46EBE